MRTCARVSGSHSSFSRQHPLLLQCSRKRSQALHSPPVLLEPDDERVGPGAALPRPTPRREEPANGRAARLVVARGGGQRVYIRAPGEGAAAAGGMEGAAAVLLCSPRDWGPTDVTAPCSARPASGGTLLRGRCLQRACSTAAEARRALVVYRPHLISRVARAVPLRSPRDSLSVRLMRTCSPHDSGP